MDVEMINNIMTNADREEVSFSDAQWLYLNDVNQGSYNNVIQWVTTVLKQQFIDYTNAYFRIPVNIETLNPLPDSITGGNAASTVNHRPPTVALKQSVLSLVQQLVCSTDQGQQIVNDNYTQFINNLRLEVENDESWMRSEGELINYSYDRWQMKVPSQFTAGNLGPTNPTGSATGTQSSVNFLAPQGIEPGAANNAPLTNDPNLLGNNTLAFGQIVTSATNVFTSIGGVSTAGTGAVSVPFFFSDGRVAYFDVTTAAGVISFIGGVTIADGAAGSTRQAFGSTSVLDQANVGEVVTLPITFGTAGVIASIGGIATTGVIPASAAVYAAAYGQISGFNPNANHGFLDRVTILQNSSTYLFTAAGGTTPNGILAPNGAHTYAYKVIIPLKLLHDFFRQLDFPIINVGFKFDVYLAQPNGPAGTGGMQYPPLQTSNNTLLITGGGDNTPYPSIYYGRLQGGTGEACRLYYRVVKFSPADNARMAEKLTTGFTKSVKFISTDWVKANNTVAIANGSVFNYQFSTSVVHPLRVWPLFYPMVNYGGAGVRESLADPNYAPGVQPALFLQTNILVNNGTSILTHTHAHQILLYAFLVQFCVLPLSLQMFHNASIYNLCGCTP